MMQTEPGLPLDPRIAAWLMRPVSDEEREASARVLALAPIVKH